MIFSDDVKIGIVRPRTPRILRQHLRLSAMEYGGDYQRFREKIESFWMAQDRPVAMVTGASPLGKPVSAKDVEDMECDYMTQQR